VRLVGKTKAMEMILTGAPITAQEALVIGLVNRVVQAVDLMNEARTLAADLSTKAPIALRHAMEAINRGAEMTFADGCQLEAALFGMVTTTDDMREGTRAFLEKRKADFKGR
jgi:enoyl-CoA hydratase